MGLLELPDQFVDLDHELLPGGLRAARDQSGRAFGSAFSPAWRAQRRTSQ